MEKSKKCPYCGEKILAVAKKCKHCGEWLDKEEDEEMGKNTHSVVSPKYHSAEELPLAVEIGIWIFVIVIVGIGVYFMVSYTFDKRHSHDAVFIKAGLRVLSILLAGSTPKIVKVLKKIVYKLFYK